MGVFMVRLFFVLAFMGLLAGCTGAPKGIAPVENFNAKRYQGLWYEIARSDNPFERGLSRVTATYTLREDGGIAVLNRGYDAQAEQWKSAQGRAYFVDKPDLGHLKVSFFGPFYAAYVIYHLDPEYRYAFVTGHNRDYLWLLSREPKIPSALRQQFMNQAAALGFDTQSLVWVEQEVQQQAVQE